MVTLTHSFAGEVIDGRSGFFVPITRKKENTQMRTSSCAYERAWQ